MSSVPLKPFSDQALSLSVGQLYQHYKNKRYKLLAIARHSETLEELVVYQALYGDQGIWVRPLGMFMEKVIVEGVTIPRFRLIEEKA